MEYKKKNKYDMTLQAYNSVKSKLKDLAKKLSSKPCFLGFDGYIDSIYSLVKSRINPNKWERRKKMSTFGEIIQDVAGSAANIERVLKRRTSGGVFN